MRIKLSLIKFVVKSWGFFLRPINDFLISLSTLTGNNCFGSLVPNFPINKLPRCKYYPYTSSQIVLSSTYKT